MKLSDDLWQCHNSGDFGKALEGYAERAQNVERQLSVVIGEHDQLLAQVKEWACDDCNTVCPGPPQKLTKCVVCPKCGGSTMPHELLNTRRAEAQRDELLTALRHVNGALNSGVQRYVIADAVTAAIANAEAKKC